MTKMYLDIETTGFSAENDYPTIVGMYIVDDYSFATKLCNSRFIQLVYGTSLGENIIEEYINEHEVTEVVGYNIIKFDIPFLENNELTKCECFKDLLKTDLMYTCWDLGLKGGLKEVEKVLGIKRFYETLNFFQQQALWSKWLNTGDTSALARYLNYNRDDVVNLAKVESGLIDYKEKKKKEHEEFMKKWKAKREGIKNGKIT